MAAVDSGAGHNANQGTPKSIGWCAKATRCAKECYLCPKRWWFKEGWQYYGRSKPDPENLIGAVASLLNGWIGTTVALGAVLWGTATDPHAINVLPKTAEELAEEARILQIKIIAYVAVSIVMAGAVIGVSRMLARPRKSGKPKRSRTDYATDRFSRWSFASIFILTIFAAYAAKTKVFPGQQRPDNRALPFRFRVDGEDGIKVIDSLIFDESAAQVDVIATLDPKIGRSWKMVHIDEYIGGRDAIDKPGAETVRVGLDQLIENPKKVTLHNVEAHKPYTLVFLLHPADEAAKRTRMETIRFLNDYANGFTLVPVVPQKNP